MPEPKTLEEFIFYTSSFLETQTLQQCKFHNPHRLWTYISRRLEECKLYNPKLLEPNRSGGSYLHRS